MLGSRDRLIYGGLSLSELEAQIKGFATDLGIEVGFSPVEPRG